MQLEGRRKCNGLGSVIRDPWTDAPGWGSGEPNGSANGSKLALGVDDIASESLVHSVPAHFECSALPPLLSIPSPPPPPPPTRHPPSSPHTSVLFRFELLTYSFYPSFPSTQTATHLSVHLDTQQLLTRDTLSDFVSQAPRNRRLCRVSVHHF